MKKELHSLHKHPSEDRQEEEMEKNGVQGATVTMIALLDGEKEEEENTNESDTKVGDYLRLTPNSELPATRTGHKAFDDMQIHAVDAGRKFCKIIPGWKEETLQERTKFKSWEKTFIKVNRFPFERYSCWGSTTCILHHLKPVWNLELWCFGSDTRAFFKLNIKTCTMIIVNIPFLTIWNSRSTVVLKFKLNKALASWPKFRNSKFHSGWGWGFSFSYLINTNVARVPSSPSSEA